MAIPQSQDLVTLDVSFEGQPYVVSSIAASNVLATLDFSFEGQPLVSNEATPGLVEVPDAEQLEFGEDWVIKITVGVDESLEISDTGTPTLIVQDTEQLELSDEFALTIIVPDVELLEFQDDVVIPLVATTELLEFLDEFGIHIDVFDSELLELSDEFTIFAIPDSGITEQLELSDEFFIQRYIQDDEQLELGDSIKIAITAGLSEALEFADDFSIRRTALLTFSGQTQIAVQHRISSSGETIIQHYAPNPVNSFTNPLNPLMPTIIDGIPYWDATQLVDGNCKISRLSISLTLTGGTFEIQSEDRIGPVGSLVGVMGMSGTVTEEEDGFDPEGPGADWITSGIFGSRNLNRQILLTSDANGISGISGLAPTQYLETPPRSAWSTLSGAAGAIANYGDISLIWATQDSPLLDSFLQSGMTVGDALTSLASRVKAILIWAGGDTYVVTDPQSGFGGFAAPPECGLIQALRKRAVLDVTEPMAIIPIAGANQGDSQKVPGTFAPIPPPKKEQLLVETTKRPSTLPPMFIGLPGDYNTTFQAQTYVDDMTGQSSPYLTTDRDQWFPISLPITLGTDKKKRVEVDLADLTSGLKSNKFQLSIAYTRNETALQNSFIEGGIDDLERQRALLQAENEKIHYVPLSRGYCRMTFYGAMPFAGNRFGATLFGTSLLGTIESVNYSYPSQVLVVNVTDYAKINRITPRYLIDYQTATSGSIPPA